MSEPLLGSSNVWMVEELELWQKRQILDLIDKKKEN
jgi:hypothetical protein